MPEYEAYVQRYAKGNVISVEEARQHAIVKEVKRHYESSDSADYNWW